MIQARRLVGKVAMITGSTDGIGFGIARRLAQEGADVMISSRTQSNVDDAIEKLRSEKLNVSGTVCDVADDSHRNRLIKETLRTYGGIDILVNSAVYTPPFKSIVETTEELWDQVFDVNLKASFFLSKAALPHLIERGGGSILYVASAGGYHTGQHRSAFTVSKTAIYGLTKALVPECVGVNIRVNCLAPGFIESGESDEVEENPLVMKKVIGRIPMKRPGTVEECAAAAAFLCSDDASYMTGEVLPLAGGGATRL
ncbi:dehydrogenase/reductase SDR family member 4-like [Glandiceps talaboti]